MQFKAASGAVEEYKKIEQYVLETLFKCKTPCLTPYDFLIDLIDEIKKTIIITKETLELVITKANQITTLIFLCSPLIVLVASIKMASHSPYVIAITSLIESLKALNFKDMLNVIEKYINFQYKVY